MPAAGGCPIGKMGVELAPVGGREEAAEASYQDAIRHAGVAEEYGVKARDLARRRLREMGR